MLLVYNSMRVGVGLAVLFTYLLIKYVLYFVVVGFGGCLVIVIVSVCGWVSC